MTRSGARVHSVLMVDGDPTAIRLGAGFDATTGADATRDRITFANSHGLKTADRVINDRAGAAPGTMFVLVIDAQTIKLLDHDPVNGLKGTHFGGADVTPGTGRITNPGHGFAGNALVTCHRPGEVTFNGAWVDLNAAGSVLTLDARVDGLTSKSKATTLLAVIVAIAGSPSRGKPRSSAPASALMSMATGAS